MKGVQVRWPSSPSGVSDGIGSNQPTLERSGADRVLLNSFFGASRLKTAFLKPSVIFSP
jgi:hypothetical protein